MTFVRIKPSRRRCKHTEAHLGPLFESFRCRELADWTYGDDHNREYGPLCMRHMLERIERDRKHRMRIDGYGDEPEALCGGCRKCRGLDCLPECDSGCIGKPAEGGRRRMKTPQQVWDACANDDRWIDNQVAVVDQIMREAFAAGFAAAAELAGRCVEVHLDGIASNLALRMPESVPKGLRVLAEHVREFAGDVGALQRAWREAAAGAGPRSLHLLPPTTNHVGRT